ncbi:MAG: TrmH family RNA methyltransferase [Oceanipulchritudo sp.]
MQNPRVKNLVRLRDGGYRRRRKRFLIEGLREISRALACRWPLETIFFCEEAFTGEAAFELLHEAEAAGLELVRLAPDPFAKCAYRQGPDGLLATGIQKTTTLREFILPPDPLVVILESIEKPGNLGAIFRAANAAGADALVLAESVTDPYNPNTIRASQGAFFQVPFASCDNAEAFVFLEEAGLNPVLTSPSAGKTLWEADLRGPTALVLGSEDTGLSADWLETFPSYRIPMRGLTDSLNVASTAAVALFEAVRQRQ